MHEKLIVLLVLTVGSNASANLAGHWKLDEGSGITAHDVSGSRNDDVFKGEPEWIVGKIGGALEFDGDDYVDCGNDTSLDLTGPISIAAWIRPKADETQQVAPLCKATSGPEGWSWQLRYGWNSPKPYMGFVFNATGGRVLVYVNQNLMLSEWCHVAASYDGSTVRCYLNGKETDSADMTGFAGGRSPLLIGQDGWHDCWIGAIDDVRIYSHGLYEEEVKQLCSRGDESVVPPALLKLTNGLHKAKSIAEIQGPQKAIIFLEEKIAEYELWKKDNTNEVEVRHEWLSSELYFLLAKAKEAANAPTTNVATAYKQSISQQFVRRNHVPALLWLFKNMSAVDYVDAVKESVRNSSGTRDNLNHIAKDFESSGNWTAFKLFLDATLAEVDHPVSYAKAIAAGLRRNGTWANNFLRYAQGKPQLTQYILATCDKRAQEKIAQNKFLKAAEIYRNIVNQCGSEKDKATYELKALECVFGSGDYRRVLPELISFIKDNKAGDKVLVREAMLLKARAHMHLNEIDRAKTTLSELVADYPHTEQAHEADFFTGYYSMLQGKYKEAVEALNRVVRDRPQSSYANKARLCLVRIKRVTE